MISIGYTNGRGRCVQRLQQRADWGTQTLKRRTHVDIYMYTSTPMPCATKHSNSVMVARLVCGGAQRQNMLRVYSEYSRVGRFLGSQHSDATVPDWSHATHHQVNRHPNAREARS